MVSLRLIIELLLCLIVKGYTFLNEICAELLDQKLSLLGCNFCLRPFDFKVFLLLLSSELQDMHLRNDLTLSFGRNFLHEIYHSVKHGLVLLEGVKFFPGANEDEFGVLLSGSSFHLDEGFDSQELVQADDLIAGRDIEAFLNDIGGDENVQHASSKLI